MKRLLLLLLHIAIACSTQEARYDNYKVYSLIPETEEEITHLKYIQQSDLPFEFWSQPNQRNIAVNVLVSPHSDLQFQELISKFQLKAEVKIENIQKLIDENINDSSEPGGEYDWTQYHNLDEINKWLNNLAISHQSIVKLITVGRSYEGRDIKGVKVSYKEGNKAVFIEGGIHAIEWISPATVTYILNELLTSENEEVMEVARNYDWYIVPSINPDGYEHTFKKNRLWRKTRQPNGICVGTDGNRNWDFHWNEVGTTGQCLPLYPGSAPFSAPEMKSLSEYITSIATNLVAYISMHSFGQKLLIPYGHGEYAENYPELLEVGKKVVASLEKRHGTKFSVGNSKEELYPTSGVSVDWVKAVHKVPFTYTFELRDKGLYGFLLPKRQIIPVGEEIMDSLVTLIQEIKDRGY